MKPLVKSCSKKQEWEIKRKFNCIQHNYIKNQKRKYFLWENNIITDSKINQSICYVEQLIEYFYDKNQRQTILKIIFIITAIFEKEVNYFLKSRYILSLDMSEGILCINIFNIFKSSSFKTRAYFIRSLGILLCYLGHVSTIIKIISKILQNIFYQYFEQAYIQSIQDKTLIKTNKTYRKSPFFIAQNYYCQIIQITSLLMKAANRLQNQQLEKTKQIHTNHNNHHHQSNPYYQIQINYIAKEQSTEVLQFNTIQTPNLQLCHSNEQKFNNVCIYHQHQSPVTDNAKKSGSSTATTTQQKCPQSIVHRDKKELKIHSPNYIQKRSLLTNQNIYSSSNSSNQKQIFNFSKVDHRESGTYKDIKFVPKFIGKKKQRQLDRNIQDNLISCQISQQASHKTPQKIEIPELPIFNHRLFLLEEQNKKLIHENQLLREQIEWFQGSFSTARMSSEEQYNSNSLVGVHKKGNKVIYSSRIYGNHSNKQSLFVEDILSNRSWKSRSIKEECFNFKKHEKRQTDYQKQVSTNRQILKCQILQKKCLTYEQIISKMQIKIKNLIKQNKQMMQLEKQNQEHRQKLGFLQQLVEKIIQQYEGLQMSVAEGDQEWEKIKMKWEQERELYRNKIKKLQGTLKVPGQIQKKSLQQSVVTLLSHYQQA